MGKYILFSVLFGDSVAVKIALIYAVKKGYIEISTIAGKAKTQATHHEALTAFVTQSTRRKG
ncbi:hypothetical protein NFHSH190041_29000 [Shewanella sp. NFH-SH190041]|nr:hypothetical protein NFHSH190041_29000 [Shewanella sp. NFH-SH190041]